MRHRLLYLLIAGVLGIPGGLFAEMPAPGGSVTISSRSFDLEELDQPVQFVEPEFDPGLLEDLPPPDASPNAANMPKLLIGKDQWQGSICGISRPNHAVFRQPGTWERFWTLAVRPYAPRQVEVPTVDFQKDFIIGVFAGEKPYPGHEIRITGTKVQEEAGEKILVVRFKNEQKMRGVFNPPMSIRPFHLKRVPAFKGRVVFLEDQ